MKRNYGAINIINKRRRENSERKAREAQQPAEANEAESGEQPMEVVNDGASTSAGHGSTGSSGVGIDGGATIGSAGGAGNQGGAGGNIRGEAQLPMGMPIFGARYQRYFTRQYHIRIFNEFHQRKTADLENGVYAYLIPSFHDLPVHMATFFLMPQEIIRLQQSTSARILQVGVKVSTNTAILTFETNATTTATGNNNVGIKLIEIDPNVCLHRQGTYERDQGDVVRDNLHGLRGSDMPASTTLTTDFSNGSAELITRNYDNKFIYTSIKQVKATAIPGQGSTTVINLNQDFFPIMRYVKQRRNASIEEGPFLNWEHKCKSGLIASNAYITENTSAQTGANEEMINLFGEEMAHQHAKNNNPAEPNTTNKAGPLGRSLLTENFLFSTIYKQNFRNYQNPYQIPTDAFSTGGVGFERMTRPIIGFEPLTSINSTAGVPTPAKAHIDCWTVF